MTDTKKLTAKIESELINFALDRHYENSTSYSLDHDKPDEIKRSYELYIDETHYDLPREIRSEIIAALYKKHGRTTN